MVVYPRPPPCVCHCVKGMTVCKVNATKVPWSSLGTIRSNRFLKFIGTTVVLISVSLGFFGFIQSSHIRGKPRVTSYIPLEQTANYQECTDATKQKILETSSEYQSSMSHFPWMKLYFHAARNMPRLFNNEENLSHEKNCRDTYTQLKTNATEFIGKCAACLRDHEVSASIAGLYKLLLVLDYGCNYGDQIFSKS